MTTETTTPRATEVLFLGRSAAEAGEIQPAITLGQAMPSIVNGQPAKYFWCNGLKVGGNYSAHTVDARTGMKKRVALDVPEKMATALLANASKMKERGVRVPVVTDHATKADNARGWAPEFRRNGEWIQGLLQMIGEDAILAAARNEVSFGVSPHFVDGENYEYGPAITHVALTPIPVVPNQQGLIAASRAEGDEAPTVFLLSAAESIPPTPERSPAMKKEHRDKALKLLGHMNEGKGLPADTDDDALTGHLLGQHEMLQSDNASVHGQNRAIRDYCHNLSMADLTESPDISEEERAKVKKNQEFMPALTSGMIELSRHADEAEAKLSAAQGEVRNLSRNDRTPDPELMLERQKRVGAPFALLVERQIATPAQAMKIRDAIIGREGSPNTMFLSREEGATDCVAANLVDLLLELRPAPKLGDATGAYQLSRAQAQSGPIEQEREITSPLTGEKVKVPTVA